MKVYLDNAATTPLESTVVQAMTEVMHSCHGNPSSIHQAGRKARTIIEDARKRVAQRLNASTGEIFFTSSATESNNMVLFCAARDLGVQRIISSPTEHPCVLNSLKHVATVFPINIEYLKVDSRGNIDYRQLDGLLSNSDQKTLVSLMHGNNEIGTMIDIRKVSTMCQENGALFHTDAVQTVGKFHLDLNEIPVNFLSASGHKIYGPKGIGIVYINSESMIDALIKGGGQERKLRSGTENIYGIVGFAAALDWLCDNRDMHREKITELRNHFKRRAGEFNLDIQYNGNQEENYLYNILSITVPRSEKTDLITFNLDINGICASAGSACSSGAQKDSHVLEAIGVPDDRKTVRFSISHQNNQEEIDYVVEKLASIL